MSLKVFAALALSVVLGTGLSGCENECPEVAEVSLTESTTVPGSVKDFCETAGDRVYFDFDKFHLTEEAKATLMKQADWLKKYPSVTVNIVGSCDERGTEAYNLGLGHRRAYSVVEFLKTLGIGVDRLSHCSIGKSHPIVEGHDESAYAKNRTAISVLFNTTDVVRPMQAPMDISVQNVVVDSSDDTNNE